MHAQVPQTGPRIEIIAGIDLPDITLDHHLTEIDAAGVDGADFHQANPCIIGYIAYIARDIVRPILVVMLRFAPANLL